MACGVSVLSRGHSEDGSPGVSWSPITRWGFSLRLRSEKPDTSPVDGFVPADQTFFGTPSPLRVKSKHGDTPARCPLYPRKRTFVIAPLERTRNAALLAVTIVSVSTLGQADYAELLVEFDKSQIFRVVVLSDHENAVAACASAIERSLISARADCSSSLMSAA